MISILFFAGLVSLVPPQSKTGADDWPQFMGPDRTGKSAPRELSFDWSEEPPEVVWRVDVGPGFGGAAVKDGEVFLLDREVGEIDILRVMELATGEPIWDTIYEASGRLSYAGSRTVPTVTAEHVITCGGQGRVMCFDREAREDIWTVSLEEDYGGLLPGYGWSCSPVIVGDLVVLSVLGGDVGLVALDRATGEEAWVTKPVGISHSTPVVLNLLGEEQIVFVSTPPGAPSLNAAGVLTISSFRPDDGTLLWETETVGSTYPIPGPVQVGDDGFFVTGGYRGGSALLRISKKEDAYAFERVFYSERGAQIHNPILHDDHLYLLVNENWNEQRNRRAEGGLMCLDLEGKELWRTGAAPFFGRGNAILVNDHLLIQDGHDGTLRAVRATPKGYEEVGALNVFGITDRRDHQMWAAMALAGDLLLMRSQEELLCVRL